MNSALQLVSV